MMNTDCSYQYPFALSLSKGRSWFDKLTTNGVGKPMDNPE